MILSDTYIYHVHVQSKILQLHVYAELFMLWHCILLQIDFILQVIITSESSTKHEHFCHILPKPTFP